MHALTKEKKVSIFPFEYELALLLVLFPFYDCTGCIWLHFIKHWGSRGLCMCNRNSILAGVTVVE